MTQVHAFGDDVLGDLDAVGLVEAMAQGLSAAEVVEAAVARVESVDGALGAVAHRAFDRAREEARNPRPGFFAGVPTFLKDNVAVAGMPLTDGTDAWDPVPEPADGDFARMYLATGLLPLGTTRMSEYGFSAAADHVRLGPVRSPWHLDHYAGASSSGSAALVAAGAVPLAHGNDGGGSIRIPAAVNGLVGLKPTRNRLAQDKLMRDMPVRIVSDGVLTRSVRDTAAFYREAEKVWRNPALAPVGDIRRPGRARLRIAVVTEGVGRRSTPEVAALTLATAARLEELGHTVEQIDHPVPDSFADHFLLYWSMLALAMVTTGRRAHGRSWDRDKLDNLTLGLASHCRRNLHRLPAAVVAMQRSRHLAAEHHRTYDLTLTPTLATETPRVGWLRPDQPYEVIMDRLLDWVAFTPWQNATGEPAISLPLATTAAGLPQGMMFGAGHGREARLLEFGLEVEQALGWAGLGTP
ncbi:MAG: amidase [Nocardioides sp.]|uniref:amidase n=1 Tax=Nocardioides sp. TaxID=35761 RepID=UPI003F0753C0